DLQSQAMAGAVKKALHSTIVFAGFVALANKKLLHRLVDLDRRHPGPDRFERDLLALQHGGIKFPHGFVSTATHNRPRDVAEVTCLLRARKDINDDRLMCSQWPEASLVRVTRLVPSGDDCVLGHPAGLNDCSVNGGPQPFRSERH